MRTPLPRVADAAGLSHRRGSPLVLHDFSSCSQRHVEADSFRGILSLDSSQGNEASRAAICDPFSLLRGVCEIPSKYSTCRLFRPFVALLFLTDSQHASARDRVVGTRSYFSFPPARDLPFTPGPPSPPPDKGLGTTPVSRDCFSDAGPPYSSSGRFGLPRHIFGVVFDAALFVSPDFCMDSPAGTSTREPLA